MANICRRPKWLDERDNHYFYDDFYWLVTAHHWTTLVADTTPTVTVPDTRGGILRLFSDTTDNNEVAVRTTVESFLLTAGRPLWGMAKIQYAEAGTAQANVFVGFADAIGANMLVDNGAGMRASGSIIAIYKIDGGSVWRCHTRDNSGTTDTVSTTTAGGSAYVELEMEALEYTGTQASVVFKVDGNYLKDANGNVIRHTMAYASLTEMSFGLYLKTGGAGAGEVLLCDYAAAGQVR